MIYYTNVYILYFQDEANLIMVDDFFDIFLYSACQYFIGDLCIYVYQEYQFVVYFCCFVFTWFGVKSTGFIEQAQAMENYLFPSTMADNFSGYSNLDWESCSFRVSIEKSGIILMAFPLYVFVLLQLSIFLFFLHIQCFDYEKPTQDVCLLVLFSWSFMCFLYLYGYVLPQFREVFFYDFAKDLVYAIDLRFFYIFYALNSNIWSFGDVLHSLYVPFLCFKLFLFLFFVLSRFSSLCLNSDILSSA